MGAVCSALEQSGLGTGISHENIQALNTYWSQIRKLYEPFEANVRASDSGVFDHEMPGGCVVFGICFCLAGWQTGEGRLRFDGWLTDVNG